MRGIGKGETFYLDVYPAECFAVVPYEHVQVTLSIKKCGFRLNLVVGRYLLLPQDESVRPFRLTS